MSRSVRSAGIVIVATLITFGTASKGAAFVSIRLRRGGNPTEPIKALMKKALAKLK